MQRTAETRPVKLSTKVFYLGLHISYRLAGTDNYKAEEASHNMKLHAYHNCGISTEMDNKENHVIKDE